MRIWKKIKIALYILISVSIALFMGFYTENLHYFIGSIINLYAIEMVCLSLKDHKLDLNKFLQGALEIILGTTITFFLVDFEAVCIVWAVWALLRESREISEHIELIKEKEFAYVSLLESFISIAFAISLLLNPTEHHVSLHMYLLIVEMTSTVTFPIIRKKLLNKKGNSN